MTTARIVKQIKTQDQIRIELEQINKEFKVNFTMDIKIAEGQMLEIAQHIDIVHTKQKKLRHYEPMPTIIEEAPMQEEPRLKR